MIVLDASKLNSMNSQVLAFVGDAHFSLYIRTYLVLKHDYKSGELTRLTSGYVKAVSQSKMLGSIMPLLSEFESDVARRGRNCHTGTKAKNAGLMDYKRATALESLFGYLYLSGKLERLDELEEKCMHAIDLDADSHEKESL